MKTLLAAGALSVAAGCVSDNGPVQPRPTARPAETVQPEPTCAEQIAALSTGVQDQTVVAAFIDEVCEGSDSRLTVAPLVEPTDERCNGIDDDLDGIVDNVGPEFGNVYARDEDGDGAVVYSGTGINNTIRENLPDDVVVGCEAPGGYVELNEGNAFADDCDDTDPNVRPSVMGNAAGIDFPLGGIIDDKDQDCDGILNGGFTSPLPHIELNGGEGRTIGGLIDSMMEESGINGVTGAALRYLGYSLLDATQSALSSNDDLARALIAPSVEAGARVFVTTNLAEYRHNIDNVIYNLEAMLSYARTVDLETERNYLASLTSDNLDQFIYYGPNEDAPEDPRHYDHASDREYQAIVFRRLDAGVPRETIVWTLELAISKLREFSAPIVVAEGSAETAPTEGSN